MKQSSLTLINKRGLHARAATKLVETAKTFDCSVEVSFDGREADGKSIMSLLMLAAGPDSEITFTTCGQDEETALQAIQTLIQNRFYEEE